MDCDGGHGCGGEGRANSACGIVSLVEKRGGKKNTVLFKFNYFLNIYIVVG